jgi:hypothetical protein
MDLSNNIKDYLVSIGFDNSFGSGTYLDFISQIIKNQISKKELLEMLVEDEISHITSMIRDSKISDILKH